MSRTVTVSNLGYLPKRFTKHYRARAIRRRFNKRATAKGAANV